MTSHPPQSFRRELNIFAALLCLLPLLFFAPATAQSIDTPAETPVPTEPQPLTEELVTKLDTLREALPEQRAKIAELEQRVAAADGFALEILNRRLDLAWLGLLDSAQTFAAEVVAAEQKGFDVSAFSADAIEALVSQLSLAITTINRAKASVNQPDPDLSAADQAAAYSDVFKALDVIDRAYDVFTASIEVSRQFELDVTASEQLLHKGIEDRALNASVFLEKTLRDIEARQAALATAPDDAELKARLNAAQLRLTHTASELDRITRRMNQLDLDTTQYREMLVTATGDITTDIFNFKVIGNMMAKWWQKTIEAIADFGPTTLFRLLLFLFIIFIARKIANFAKMLVMRAMSSSHVQVSRLLERMIVSTISNVIFLFGILIALSQLGISLGPLLAGLGIAGFVIGFALQDTLSNFASGMMILLYRPFDVGDLIEAGGVLGKVNQMSLVNTTILTIDNQTVVVPNNMIWQGIIKNVTGQTKRRVDLLFGVSYSDDIPKVEKVLKDIIDTHDKILKDPAAEIRLHELGDSSVNFIVRPWVNTDDYWDVYWDLMRTVKIRFDEEGISIPFPQRDVHHYPAVPESQPGTAT